MDILISSGLIPQARIGLVIGLISDNVYIYHLAKVPSVGLEIKGTLGEILNREIQRNFSMKNWLLEHAVQVRKLILPCFQILGIFTTSEEIIIEKKNITPISSEVCELLKKMNKLLKEKTLMHVHFDEKSKQYATRAVDFAKNTNYVANVKVTDERWLKLIEIKCRVPMWIELGENTEGNLEKILQIWTDLVEKFQFRFNGLETKRIDREVEVAVFSKDVKVLAEPCRVRTSGVVDSRIIVVEGTAIEVAEEMLRNDLVSNLKNRCSLITSAGTEIDLPRRVFVFEKIMVCDYLIGGEGLPDAISRIQALLDLPVQSFSSFEKAPHRPLLTPRPHTSAKYYLLLLLPILIGIFISLLRN